MSLDEGKVRTATSWSTLTQVCAKLVTPVVSLLLARLLMPDDFGLVAVITTVIAFAECVTDSGFSNYLIQHDFPSEDTLEHSAYVAFWSNLFTSLFIWLIICLSQDYIATWLGIPQLGLALSVACFSLPLGSLTSVPIALYKRNLNFRPLFFIRLVSTLAPLLITLPLAYFLRTYWALILGTLAQKMLVSLTVLITSPWKPSFYYSIRLLREMLSFSVWSVVESLSIWLTSYVDIFIVTTSLSSYYIGLYRGALSLVGQVMGLVTAITTPILFSSLSRLQSEPEKFQSFFLSFQKGVALFVFPLGILLFCYSEWITVFLLGEQWQDAAIFVAWWGLSSAFAVVFCHYCSEIYRSAGKPLLSAVAQWLHLIVLVPVILYAVRYGYEELCVARSLVRLQFILVHLFLVYWFIRFSPVRMLSNICNPFLASLGMLIVSLLMSKYFSYEWTPLCFLVSFFSYLALVLCFAKERRMVCEFINRIYERCRCW